MIGSRSIRSSRDRHSSPLFTAVCLQWPPGRMLSFSPLSLLHWSLSVSLSAVERTLYSLLSSPLSFALYCPSPEWVTPQYCWASVSACVWVCVQISCPARSHFTAMWRHRRTCKDWKCLRRTFFAFLSKLKAQIVQLWVRSPYVNLTHSVESLYDTHTHLHIDSDQPQDISVSCSADTVTLMRTAGPAADWSRGIVLTAIRLTSAGAVTECVWRSVWMSVWVFCVLMFACSNCEMTHQPGYHS